ncbi:MULTISPECIES: hypothetical protein [unclassified Streptococcus]|uniref:hypothetical protein n=1 Tax=unclassified Streptococcus TaxID=2608887 RepID=UPI00211AC4BA|nr:MULTISPECIES: hypothetical protein [unclassified Streptococcus]MCQ9212410.1 hypothetical protein [Streptococcus sp. B01]MCQ9213748.1 hypothetical protein [Streptococcus sp. O1]MCQ9214491.1 hypothetical protein [Streptococcus sp. O1]
MRQHQERPLTFWGRRKAAWEEYKATRKEIMRVQREYFASDEIDEERQRDQERRNQEFLHELKRWGIGVGIFLMIYFIMRLILGL